jgi:hypothetical protein
MGYRKLVNGEEVQKCKISTLNNKYLFYIWFWFLSEYYPTGITVDDQVQVQDAYEALAEAYSGRSYCFLTHNCVQWVSL